jgi:DNA polymerase-3 subunit gamma/tau
MPYTVFALKWRPKSFDEIIGQEYAVSQLKSALEKGRLANAYLFAGPRGVGKTSAARILAKALNCKEGPTVKPCGKCSSCNEIAGGRSLDVIEIDGASNRGIEEIRTLRENVKFAPVQGKFKVYIIDEVHQITSDGFNALLKTLEEPPEYVKFVFATTHPHKVIPTILSRCQRLDFRRIPVLEIIKQLDKIAKAESIDIDKEVLAAVARSSDGSLRDAESVLDQLYSFAKDKVSLKDVSSVLGLVAQDALFEVADAVIARDPLAALSFLNRVVDEGKDVAVFLNNLIEHFRNLMVAKVTKADMRLVDLPQDICDRLLKQSQALTMEEIFSAFTVLVNTQEMAKRLDSARIPVEIALVRLAHDKKAAYNAASAPPAPRPHTQPHHQPKPAPEPQAAKKEEPPPPEAHSLISIESVKAGWDSIITKLSQVKISVATYLNEGEPGHVKGDLLTVLFPKGLSLHKEALESKENKQIIERIVADVVGSPLRVSFVLSAEVRARTVDENSSPFLRSALDMFNGRILGNE